MIPHSRVLRFSILLSAIAIGGMPVPVFASEAPARSLAQPPVATHEPTDPRTRIGRANAAARVQPERTSYFNAIQQYAYAEGALFQIAPAFSPHDRPDPEFGYPEALGGFRDMRCIRMGRELVWPGSRRCLQCGH